MEAPSGTKQGGFALLVFSISLAIFRWSLDGAMVRIARSTFSTTVRRAATVYLIVMAGCVLVFGKISDLIGFTKIFPAESSISTAGSQMCGVLPDLPGSVDLRIVSRGCRGWTGR